MQHFVRYFIKNVKCKPFVENCLPAQVVRSFYITDKIAHAPPNNMSEYLI